MGSHKLKPKTIMKKHFSFEAIMNMEKQERVHFINSLGGFKSVSLLGTVNKVELLWRDFFRFMFKKHQTKFFLTSGISTDKFHSKSLNEKLLSLWINK